MSGKLSPLFTWRSVIQSDRHKLSPRARHIALALSLYMSERGSNAFPGIKTLAHDCGIAVRTVQYAIRELEDADFLTIKTGGGRKHTNHYEATVPETMQDIASLPKKGAKNDIGNHAKTDTETMHSAAPESVRESANGIYHVKDPPEAPPSEAFEDFWRQYPSRKGRKVGKRQALEAWLRLKPEQRELAAKAVGNYAAWCQSGPWPRDAERWLRKSLYEDFLEPVAADGFAEYMQREGLEVDPQTGRLREAI